MITIFKTPNCAYCHQTTRYLDKKGAKYQVYDVTEAMPSNINSEYQRLSRVYGYTVPLVTDGEITYVGWNLAQLNQMITGEKA